MDQMTKMLVIALLARETLSQVAGKLLSLVQRFNEAQEYNEAFDAGEFSGPASWKWLGRKVQQIVHEAGWTVEGLEKEIQERTSPRWLHFSPLSQAFAAVGGE